MNSEKPSSSFECDAVSEFSFLTLLVARVREAAVRGSEDDRSVADSTGSLQPRPVPWLLLFSSLGDTFIIVILVCIDFLLLYVVVVYF